MKQKKYKDGGIDPMVEDLVKHGYNAGDLPDGVLERLGAENYALGVRSVGVHVFVLFDEEDDDEENPNGLEIVLHDSEGEELLCVSLQELIKEVYPMDNEGIASLLENIAKGIRTTRKEEP